MAPKLWKGQFFEEFKRKRWKLFHEILFVCQNADRKDDIIFVSINYD